MNSEVSSLRIKTIVSALGLKMQGFANEIEINKQQMYRYTSGQSVPAWETLDKILSKFPNVSAEYLMRGKGAVLIE
ncbi:hypothetical protein GCM10027592_26340 [Spirosoma flavus]